MIGQKFGKLTVNKPVASYIWVSKTSGKRSVRKRYLCLCDCGGERVVEGRLLCNGMQHTCKECSYKRRSQYDKRKSIEQRVFELAVVNSAKRRGIYMDITLDHFTFLAGQSCHYCGAPPSNRSAIKPLFRTFGLHPFSKICILRCG
jgi:hypothetical protein